MQFDKSSAVSLFALQYIVSVSGLFERISAVMMLYEQLRVTSLVFADKSREVIRLEAHARCVRRKLLLRSIVANLFTLIFRYVRLGAFDRSIVSIWLS